MKCVLRSLWLSSMLFSYSAFCEVLLESRSSWDGGEIYYPKGQAEITSFILRVEEGQTPAFHCHPVPTFGYVLRGSIEIETSDGNKTLLSKGDSAIEVMKTLHRGKAVDGPVEIVVFYAGAVGIPNTLFVGHPDFDKYCDSAH